MVTKEFDSICNMMISSRMKNVETSAMKSYKIDKTKLDDYNALYKSAISDPSSLSLVYTTPGYNSLKLMMDRAKAIISTGEAPEKIMILCATDVSAQLVRNNIPDIKAMTTQDFIDNLYCANYANGCVVTDDIASANIKLKICANVSTMNSETEEFVKILDMIDPQDKAILTALYANNHKDALIDLTKDIRLKITTEAICQNTTYSMSNNPFDINAIIVNNVSNISVPTLCTILGYANRYKTNLYMIGSQDETIYAFQASYKKALDIIASFSTDKKIGIIRLENDIDTNPDIIKFMRMKPLKDKNIVTISKASAEGISNDAAIQAVFENKLGYITDKLNNKERVLICAPYSKMLDKIRDILVKTYPSTKIYQASQKFDLPMRPNMKTMMDAYEAMLKKYPNGLSVADFYFEIVKRSIPIASYNKNNRPMTNEEINDFKQTFADKSMDFFKSYERTADVTTLYQDLIKYECKALTDYYENMRKHKTIDSDFAADIVLSTIHTAIDMQYNNVVVILPDQFIRGLHFASCGTEELMFQRNVALTRATNSEHVILLPREDKSPFLSYVKNL